jgi:hypothetical protein
MTSYAGYDCLTIDPNLVTQRGVQIARAVEGFTVPTGNVVTATTGAPAVSSFTLEWGCATRADLNTLTDFLDARVGRFSPCWVPTYQRDLNVTSIDGFGHWFVTPGSAVDAMTLIPAVPAWQHWSMAGPLMASRRFDYRSEVIDVGGGVYEVKHGGGFILSAGGSLVGTATQGTIYSRAMLCRLASDDYTVRIIGRASTVTADFVEVPAEVPTA